MWQAKVELYFFRNLHCLAKNIVTVDTQGQNKKSSTYAYIGHPILKNNVLTAQIA